jgi:hypothetical protein
MAGLHSDWECSTYLIKMAVKGKMEQAMVATCYAPLPEPGFREVWRSLCPGGETPKQLTGKKM